MLDAVGLALADVDERLERPPGEARLGAQRAHALAVPVPDVEAAVEIARDQLGGAVAVEVAGGDRAQDRAARRGRDGAAREGGLAAVQRERVPVGGEAPQLAAVAAVGVDLAVGGGEDELVAVVAVEVDEQRRGGAVGGHPLRPAREQVRVAVQVELAAVLAAQRRLADGGDHDLHREGVGLGVGAAVGGLRGAAVGVAGEVARLRREPALELDGGDGAEQLVGRRGAVADGLAVAGAAADAVEVAGPGHVAVAAGGHVAAVVGVDAGRGVDRAGVAAVAARVDAAADVDRRRAGVHQLPPVGRLDRRLGGDAALADRVERAERVEAPVAVELVRRRRGPGRARVGERRDDRALGGRVEVGVGAVRSRAGGLVVGEAHVVGRALHELAHLVGVTRVPRLRAALYMSPTMPALRPWPPRSTTSSGRRR